MKQGYDSGENTVSTIIILAVMAVLAWWVFDVFLKPDTWRPLWENEGTLQIGVGPEFTNKDECLSWIQAERMYPGGRYNFECGSNCKAPNTVNGLYRCDEAVD